MRLIDRVRWRRRASFTTVKFGMGIGLLLTTASMFLSVGVISAGLGMSLAFVCFFVPILYVTWRERSLMRDLKAHGYALCTSCGYPLEGRPTDTCPECGDATTAEGAMVAWHNLVKNREGFGDPSADAS